MIKLNNDPAIEKQSFENPELLDCYPDIDYEMIPIQHEEIVFQNSEHVFDIKQLSTSGLKHLLEQADQAEFTNILENKGKGITIILKDDLSLFLPIDQINKCKKTRKFTKIYLIEGQILKTSLKYKKLKKGLLEYGFKETQKSHLVKKTKASFSQIN